MGTFGTQLRQLREQTKRSDKVRKPLTQAAFAESLDIVADLGSVSPQQISQWETDSRNPPGREMIVGMIKVLVTFNGVLHAEEGDSLLMSAQFMRLRDAEIVSLGLPPRTMATEESTPLRDEFSQILDCIKRFLEKVDVSEREQLYPLQSRMKENIERTRRYGDTMNRRSGRAEIFAQVNRLALQPLGQSLNELCN